MDNLAIIITAILAGIATYTISVKLEKGAVFGSAIVVLLSGLFLPHFFEMGTTLAVMATTSSYAGMVAAKNVPNLKEMAAVGFIAGVLFILVEVPFAGVGGKLGTIAAISCLGWIGLKKTLVMVLAKKEKQQESTVSYMK
ncbi:hypothetical protein [Isachenkonia alkalipeptolytica]|uniref:Uncharacterized protein n=1 Tax=Isachenkonia alkalipeptolytica TaxID=2565777 RepID=A0AA43XHJ1_9CLOT|nr:hypothetical protein [Isachenkonia alkalipeptolytica]NBG87008.1 hypothetical protein [Isachenkonia alkalipeptolytica]